MPNKKEKSIQPADDQSLEDRISVRLGSSSNRPRPSAPMKSATAPIDIFTAPKTAPKLPTQLKKQIDREDKPAPVVKPVTTGSDTKTPQLVYSRPTVVKPATPDVPEDTIQTTDEAEDLAPGTLDDSVSDAAVDEISASDSDELLEAEDEARGAKPLKVVSENRWQRLLKNKYTWIALAIILIAAVFALPLTRYKLLGLVLKDDYSVVVTDSKTGTAVSDATVTLDGVTAKTDASGKASVKVPVGSSTLSITKLFYQNDNQTVTVGLKHQASPLQVHLVASGRQVPVEVLDNISGKPIANATIAVIDTSAKTDASGKATIVLPTKQQTYEATISAPGYNQTTATATVAISDVLLSSNTFHLTPSGKVYFLSNANGTVNVDSANLDGSNVQTVLAGTGHESSYNTKLYNSTDWKYLMLSAQRSAATNDNGLFLITPGDNNNMTTIDQGDEQFMPVGWSGHYFVYEEQSLSTPEYQSGVYTLKSYDADTGKLVTLDQSNAVGTASSYASQYFNNFYLFGNSLIYSKLWQGDSSNYSGATYTSGIESVNINGQNQPAALEQFAMTNNGSPIVGSIFSAPYGPDEVYFDASMSDGSDQYYSYTQDGIATAAITSGQFSAASYTAGILSPSGSQAAFTTIRDGQTIVLSGTPDSTSSEQKTLATLSDRYTVYSWYTDNYLILSYKSALYIMPSSGLSSGQQPHKIINYLNE